MFTDEPIVWYNNSENLGVRVITIPLDDFAYNMLMLLIVITVLESFKVRRMSGVLNVT
jgi:lycopene cyclase domain-containing protein